MYGDSVVVPDQAVRQTAQDCSRILKARVHAISREFTRFHAISRVAWKASRAPREPLEKIARRVTIRHLTCPAV
ncbi:MAG: hypothetical protein ACI89G_002482 [Minisyncoccia bacterium]